ncbi:MAG: rRNA pseudouridine synthase, partial [Anaerolineae bacterium]|nr:rRNA pseudouridine synthase [Anaerolineae bacterium]
MEARKEERPAAPGLYRLQRVIAEAGLASRRAAEEMILAGRVTVNGHVVTVLGTKVDPARDHVTVDGRALPSWGEPLRYIVLHKPYGYLSTFTDPDGRPTLSRLIQVPERVYSVGRLDMDSEG